MPPPPPLRFSRRADGAFDVALSAEERDGAALVLSELVAEIDDDPAADDLRRLRPPAYLDDPDRDLEYQLLAGEELRTSHRAAIAAAMAALDRPVLSEDELWSFVRALNAVRLVVGTKLGIDEDAHRPPRMWMLLAASERRRWAVFLLASDLAGEATLALSGTVDR